MFEDQTFQYLMKIMMNDVSNDFDKREGSIIYDALAPAGKEFELVYKAFDRLLTEAFPMTASRDYLIQHAEAFCITPNPATNAVLRAVMIMDLPTRSVPIGTRFSRGDLNYVVTEFLGDNRYYVMCEQPGEAGNEYFGLIQPIFHVNGLKRAEIVGLAIPGTDVESTEHLRKRFKDKFGTEPFGGNMTQYKQWVESQQGVGGCKIIRHFEDKDYWVGVIIISSEWKKPTDELVDEVQEALHPILPEYTEPVIQNSGDGLAPIFHIVKVLPVKEKTINIGLHLSFADGYNWETVQEEVNTAIDDYLLHEGAMAWADSDHLICRISHIETAVLSVTGVIDIADTTLNGAQENVVLETDEIPVKGTVTNG